MVDLHVNPTYPFGRPETRRDFHGAKMQTVAAPDGELLWVSGALPGGR